MLISQGVSTFSSALEFDDVNALGTCNTKTTSLVKLPDDRLGKKMPYDAQPDGALGHVLLSNIKISGFIGWLDYESSFDTFVIFHHIIGPPLLVGCFTYIIHSIIKYFFIHYTCACVYYVQ